MEIFKIHPQAGTRRGLQVHAKAQGRPRGIYHRARRRLSHGQADGGHYRVRGRILLGKSCRRSSAWYARGRLQGLLGRQPGALRLQEADGPGRCQEASHPGTGPGHLPGGSANLQPGRVWERHPGHHPHPERRGHRQPHRQTLVKERRPHHPQKRGLHRHFALGRRSQGQGRPGQGREGVPRPCLQDPVPQGEPADEFPRSQEGPSPPRGKLLPAQRPGQVSRMYPCHVRPGLQGRQVRLLRLPVSDETGQRGLRLPQAECPQVRGNGGWQDSRERAHRVQHPGAGQAGGRRDGRHRQGTAPAPGDRRGGTVRREAAAGTALQPGGDHRPGYRGLQATHQGPQGTAGET